MRRLLLCAALFPSLVGATVRYSVTPDVKSGSLAVSVHIDSAKDEETFQIPGWSPGFYVMLGFEKKISEVKAVDSDGGSLPIDHSDARTWTVHAKPSEGLTLSYRVLGDDVGLGFFAANVKKDSAYYNGASTYMYNPQRRGEDCSLKVSLPESWRVATALPTAPDGTWTARDYDELADYPVQMGNFVERKFTVQGLPFEAVFVLPPDQKMRFDLEPQLSVIQKVSAPVIQMFAGAPFKRYLYIFHLTPLGFQGGLEHRSGTVIAIPNSPGNDISDLVAHEEFHAWNVKQIRPKLLGPFDYTSPQRTGALWFAEGVTDYYAKVLTYRSGVHDAGWLMDQFTDQVATLQSGKTRLTKTVEDASRAVWENGGFNLGDLDYYNKGLLAGLLFDAEIRQATKGKRSLDDVMRLLYRQYRLPQPGYGEDGILQAINEVAGKDETPLYNQVIRGTGELPYSELHGMGLLLVSPNDPSPLPDGWGIPSEGIPTEALKRIGLRDSDQFEGFQPSTSPATAALQVERDGAMVKLSVPLQSTRVSRYEVMADPQPTADSAARLSEWLHRPKAL